MLRIADRHTCSRCGTQFDLPPLPALTDWLSGPRGRYESFSEYVYVICPSCGKKDWAEENRFLGFLGPRAFYAVVLAISIAIVAFVIYAGFFSNF